MKITSGILVGASGRFGDMVLHTSKGRTIARQYVPHIKQRNTKLQQKQKGIFKECITYCRENKEIYEVGWRVSKDGQTCFNNAMSYMLKNAVKVKAGVAELDRSKVKHAYGNLMGGRDLKAVVEKGGKIRFSWLYETPGYSEENPTDVFCIVICWHKSMKATLKMTSIIRAEMEYEYTVPKELSRKKVAVYGFFISENGRKASEDKYLGMYLIS